jgi:uncharacterized small protein (DUF1192 family)
VSATRQAALPVKAAADPFAFAHDEQVTLTAAVLGLIDADLNGRRGRNGQEQVRADVQRMLAELDPVGVGPGGAHRLQHPDALRAHLGTVGDTATAVALLVELCDAQPWAALPTPTPLRKQTRLRVLGAYAAALGVGTSADDVEVIDRILRQRGPGHWALLAAGLAASAVGAAIGGAMVQYASVAAGQLLLRTDDLSVQVLRAQTRKQVAFHERMTAHDQASHAKAQAVINHLHERIAALEDEIARQGSEHAAQVEQLHVKVAILTEARGRMEPE